MINALFSRCDRLDVAVVVEHSERVTMLEDANKSIRQVRIGTKGVSTLAPPFGEQLALLVTR
jgi:hypothetical protein